MLNVKKKIKLILLSCILILFVNKVYAEIPVIVIAPSKKPQSISTVGTSVVVQFDEEFLKKSNEYFLGDLLSGSSTSANFFKVVDMEQPQLFN